MIERLLEITGPIQIPGRSEVFTAENFSSLISLLVEAQIGRETTAKDILFDFIVAFEARLLEVGAYGKYLDIITDEVKK